MNLLRDILEFHKLATIKSKAEYDAILALPDSKDKIDLVLALIKYCWDEPYFIFTDIANTLYELLSYWHGSLEKVIEVINNAAIPNKSKFIEYIVNKYIENGWYSASEFLKLEDKLPKHLIRKLQAQLVKTLIEYIINKDSMEQAFDDIENLIFNSKNFTQNFFINLIKHLGPQYYAWFARYMAKAINNRSREDEQEDEYEYDEYDVRQYKDHRRNKYYQKNPDITTYRGIKHQMEKMKDVLNMYDVAYVFHNESPMIWERLQEIISKSDDKAKEYICSHLYKIIGQYTGWPHINVPNPNDSFFMIDNEMKPVDENFKLLNLSGKRIQPIHKWNIEISKENQEKWRSIFHDFKIIPYDLSEPEDEEEI